MHLSLLVFLPVIATAQDQTDENSAEDSGNSDATPATRQVISQASAEKRRLDLLAQSLAPEQLHWLTVADTKVLAVFHRAWGRQTKGQVILLHGSGQHPLWPGPLQILQDFLPTKGWQTLSIALPYPEEQPVPVRQPNESTNSADGEAVEPELGSNESNEIYDDARNQISDGTHDPELAKKNAAPLETASAKALEAQAVDNILAGVASLQQTEPLKTVFVAVDTGAARLWQYLDTLSNEQRPAGVVLIDARNHVPMTTYNLLESFDNKPVSVLDITQSQDPALIKAKQDRHNAAKISGFIPYRAIDLPNTAADQQSNGIIAQQIAGFLESL